MGNDSKSPIGGMWTLGGTGIRERREARSQLPKEGGGGKGSGVMSGYLIRFTSRRTYLIHIHLSKQKQKQKQKQKYLSSSWPRLGIGIEHSPTKRLQLWTIYWGDSVLGVVFDPRERGQFLESERD